MKAHALQTSVISVVCMLVLFKNVSSELWSLLGMCTLHSSNKQHTIVESLMQKRWPLLVVFDAFHLFEVQQNSLGLCLEFFALGNILPSGIGKVIAAYNLTLEQVSIDFNFDTVSRAQDPHFSCLHESPHLSVTKVFLNLVHSWREFQTVNKQAFVPGLSEGQIIF